MMPVEIIIQTLDPDGFPIRIRMEFPNVDNETLLLTCARMVAIEFNRVRFGGEG